VGLPVSLILLAVGAVLAFAVHHDPNAAVNVHAVGWILMGVAVVGLLLSLILWERLGPGYWYGGRRTYGGPAGGPGTYPRRGYRGRRTVVEEEGPAPPPDAYDAPPPP
jgi:hypothetical protein